MKESGRMISSTVGVLKHGQTSQDTREITLMDANTASVATSGMMAASIRVIGGKTKSAE